MQVKIFTHFGPDAVVELEKQINDWLILLPAYGKYGTQARLSRSPTASHPSLSPSGGNRTIEPQIRTHLKSRNFQERQPPASLSP
jgi:hypothetical protein